MTGGSPVGPDNNYRVISHPAAVRDFSPALNIGWRRVGSSKIAKPFLFLSMTMSICIVQYNLQHLQRRCVAEHLLLCYEDHAVEGSCLRLPTVKNGKDGACIPAPSFCILTQQL